jgi:hypothetical protein
MAELVAEVLDVARERLVDAQSVVGQQRDQRGLSASAVSSRLELVARINAASDAVRGNSRARGSSPHPRR